jgi:hypothetical protein
MDDFTQFDAFQRCREFGREIAVYLSRGVFAKDPVLTTALRKTLLSVYSNIGEDLNGMGIENLLSLYLSPKDQWVKFALN